MGKNLQNSTIQLENIVTTQRTIIDDFGWEKIVQTRKSGQSVGNIDTYVVPPKWAPDLPKPFEKFGCLRSYTELMLYINKHSLFHKIGKKHAFKKYAQVALNTSCFFVQLHNWGDI